MHEKDKVPRPLKVVFHESKSRKGGGGKGRSRRSSRVDSHLFHLDIIGAPTAGG